MEDREAQSAGTDKKCELFGVRPLISAVWVQSVDTIILLAALIMLSSNYNLIMK